MSLALQQPSRPLWPAATALAAVALALVVRLPFFFPTDFPLYDGGMFFRMSQELVDSKLALPHFTAFNGGQIPFIYPPLGLYFDAILHMVTGWPMLGIVRWLPLAVNLLVVAAFVPLASALLPTRRAATLAALSFPLFPLSYQWTIMGGGVTRGFGFLFFVLGAWAMLSFARSGRPTTLLWAGLATGGAVLSHPEFGLLAVATVGIVGLLTLEGLQKVVAPAVVGAIAAVVAAPWWLTALLRFGAGPFQNTLTSVGYTPNLLQTLGIFPLTGEPVLRVLAVLAILGALVMAARGMPLVLVWVVATMYLLPRGGATPLTVPLALAVGYFLDGVVLTGLAADRSHGLGATSGRAGLAWSLVIAGWVLGYGVLENRLLLGSAERILPTLTQADRVAMAWVKQNTPQTGTFVVLTPVDWEVRDPVLEWFPALAERASLLTYQGSEWTGEYAHRSSLHSEMGVRLGSGLASLDWLSRVAGAHFTHVYLARSPEAAGPTERLRSELLASKRFRPVLDSPAASVFEKL